MRNRKPTSARQFRTDEKRRRKHKTSEEHEMTIKERHDVQMLRRNEAQDRWGMDTINTYNVGVTGATGVGKSSLINRITKATYSSGSNYAPVFV
jgi:ribosome biogenesis GTPase A